MGNIQNSINQMLGTAATAATLGKHIGQQQTSVAEQTAKRQAEIAETEEQLTATKLAYKNDTIEAAIAIRSNESTFDPEVKGKKMSEYVMKDKKGHLVQDSAALGKALDSLSEDEINALAGEVDKFRSGKLTTDRMANMASAKSRSEEELKDLEDLNKAARAAADPLSSQGKAGRNIVYQEKTGGYTRAQMSKKIQEAKGGNKYLKKSYESFRELNDRIEASRKLKFDISAATEKINRLQGGKK